MPLVVMLLGLAVGGIGLLTILFAIPIYAFGLGNTLIVSGSVGIVGGLLLFGLGTVLRELVRLRELMAARPLPRPVPLAETAAVAGAGAAALAGTVAAAHGAGAGTGAQGSAGDETVSPGPPPWARREAVAGFEPEPATRVMLEPAISEPEPAPSRPPDPPPPAPEPAWLRRARPAAEAAPMFSGPLLRPASPRRAEVPPATSEEAVSGARGASREPEVSEPVEAAPVSPLPEVPEPPAVTSSAEAAAPAPSSNVLSASTAALEEILRRPLSLDIPPPVPPPIRLTEVPFRFEVPEAPRARAEPDATAPPEPGPEPTAEPEVPARAADGEVVDEAPVVAADAEAPIEPETGVDVASAPAGAPPEPLRDQDFEEGEPIARAEAVTALEPEVTPEGAADSEASMAVEEPHVVRQGAIGEMNFRIFSDGSIIAELPDGTLRFESLQELRRYVGM